MLSFPTAAELPNVLTHVIAILQVVEVAAKEVFLVVKSKLSQPVNTLALTLLQWYELVNHSLQYKETWAMYMHSPRIFYARLFAHTVYVHIYIPVKFTVQSYIHFTLYIHVYCTHEMAERQNFTSTHTCIYAVMLSTTHYINSLQHMSAAEYKVYLSKAHSTAKPHWSITFFSALLQSFRKLQ